MPTPPYVEFRAIMETEEEVNAFVDMMQRLGCATPNKLLRIALGTQARLSDIDLPAGCFDAGRSNKLVIASRRKVS